MQKNIIVVGAGLSGSECAWQLANLGHKIKLYEMRSKKTTPAHTTSNFAELVCSNSFRSDNYNSSAVGLLHKELRELKSIILQSADKHKVPAGDALAVDRTEFSLEITNQLSNHENIEVVNEEFVNLKEIAADQNNIIIIATGPLTSDNLSKEIMELIDNNALNFFDAIAPIIYKDSIDFSKAWFQSRYDKGEGKDYINCPLDEEQYDTFYNELINAQYMEFEEWEKNVPFFEGCLPIEVMASRGKNTLLFGPMKPVGLTNIHDNNSQPHAIIQLRQDNKQGTIYNIVGFQTKLKYNEQKRIFRLIPGLENAQFAKLGSIHKNTFINSPELLNKDLSLKSNDNIFFAGQISGCEGYIESTAMGLNCALCVHAKITDQTLDIPITTAIGSIYNHVVGENVNDNYQPMNVNFGLFPNIETTQKKIKKSEKRTLLVERAINDFNKYKQFLENNNLINLEKNAIK